MISYSQNFEDVILNRCFKNKERGFYLDIGAAHPDICSCTKLFYQKGWSGINVEPQESKIKLFNKYRKRDININAAVSHKEGIQAFYEFEKKAFAHSSLHYRYVEKLKDLKIKHKVRNIPVMTLDQMIEKYRITTCDFMNIDCEGSEKEVLLGWTNKKFCPTVVLIESVEPMISAEDNRIEMHEKWEPLMLDKGYQFVYADGINRFYLHVSHLHLIEHFKFPPNVLDNFKRHRAIIPSIIRYFRSFISLSSKREMGVFK